MRARSTRRLLPDVALFLSGAIAGAGIFALVKPPAPAPLPPPASASSRDGSAEALSFARPRPSSPPEPVHEAPLQMREAPRAQAPAVDSAAEEPRGGRPPHPEDEAPPLPSVTRDAREVLRELRYASPGPERDALVREAIVAVRRLPEEEQAAAMKALDEATAPEPVRTVGAPSLDRELEQVLNAPDASTRATRIRAFLQQVNQLPEGEQAHWLQRLDKATAQQSAGQGSR